MNFKTAWAASGDREKKWNLQAALSKPLEATWSALGWGKGNHLITDCVMDQILDCQIVSALAGDFYNSQNSHLNQQHSKDISLSFNRGIRNTN